MPTKATANENSVAATGNPYLDTLILGDKWNDDHAVTFWFNDRDEPEQAWTEAGKDAIRNALAAYENYIAIEFEEVDNAADANFVLEMHSQDELSDPGEDVLGVFGPITENDDQLTGKFQYDWGRWTPEHLQVGGFGFGALVLHELGHGLGLGHPHGSGGLAGEPFPGVENSGDLGDDDQNWGIWTVMSYNDSGELWSPLPLSSDFGWGFQGTPMAFDVAALQAIYGANTSYRSGDSTWTLPDTNGEGTFWTTLWDAGGTDTMRHLGAAAATLDLREAPLTGQNAGGYLSRVDGIAGGFIVANGADIENAEGGGGADTIWGNTLANTLDGNGGSDVIHGLGGADTIEGDAGNDQLFGDDGHDDLTGGAGNDTLQGGTGNDDLDGGTGNDILYGQDGHDDLVGGTGNDNLYGDAGHDLLDGGSGNDYLRGHDGNDIMQGGAGDDSMVGDGGVDTADYAGATGTVRVDLDLFGAQDVGGGEGFDTLSGIEDLVGSNSDGGGGIIGEGFADGPVAYGDELRGHNGANRLYGLGGNDILEGRGGSDVLDGGMGVDTASYESAASGVSVNLSIVLPQNTLGAGIDSFISIENLTGSEHADILLGDGQANALNGRGGADWLLGGAGNDRLDGGAGNDIVSGGEGNDRLIGGIGIDVVSYLTAALAVTVSLAIGGYQNTLGAGTDQIGGVENLHGSAFDDTLTGSAIDNVVLGGDGDDAIDGGGGNDRLGGGLGDDTLVGGAGIDTVDFSAATGPITVDLTLAGPQDTGEGFDAFSGIENLIGSAFGDDFTGQNFLNRFDGGDGDDELRGGSGVDALNGDAGADLIVGDAGNDTIDGGADIDRLYGGSGDDAIDGGGGADVLVGGPGIDRVDGGDGADRLYADDTADTFVFAGLAGAGDRVFGFQSGVHHLEIDGAGFGGAPGAFAFATGATPTPAGAQLTLLYDTDDGKLYLDADGSDPGARVHVLTLVGAPTLTAGDMLLV